MKGLRYLSGIFLIVILIFALLPLMACGDKGVPTTKPTELINLKFAIGAPEFEPIAKNLWNPIFDEMEALYPGQLKITRYFNQTLLTVAEGEEGTAKGIADISSAPNVFCTRTTLATVLGMPGLWPDLPTGIKVAWDIVKDCKSITEQANKGNLMIFMPQATERIMLVTKKPVKSISDLKGMQVATMEIPVAQGLDIVGAVSITNIPPEDWYMALQRGTIDGVASFHSTMMLSSFFEVAKYGLVGQWSDPVSYLFMNLGTWNKLPTDMQKSFIKIAEEKTLAHAEAIVGIDEDYIRQLKDHGAEISNLSQADLDSWLNICAQVRETWATQNGDVGRQVLKCAEDKAAKYR